MDSSRSAPTSNAVLFRHHGVAGCGSADDHRPGAAAARPAASSEAGEQGEPAGAAPGVLALAVIHRSSTQSFREVRDYAAGRAGRSGSGASILGLLAACSSASSICTSRRGQVDRLGVVVVASRLERPRPVAGHGMGRQRDHAEDAAGRLPPSRARSVRATVQPSITGRSMSSSTMSGCSAADLVQRLLPVMRQHHLEPPPPQPAREESPTAPRGPRPEVSSSRNGVFLPCRSRTLAHASPLPLWEGSGEGAFCLPRTSIRPRLTPGRLPHGEGTKEAELCPTVPASSDMERTSPSATRFAPLFAGAVVVAGLYLGQRAAGADGARRAARLRAGAPAVVRAATRCTSAIRSSVLIAAALAFAAIGGIGLARRPPGQRRWSTEHAGLPGGGAAARSRRSPPHRA